MAACSANPAASTRRAHNCGIWPVAPAVFSGADRTVVRLRSLDDAEIDRYITTEPALDCAGSFKCEGLGITLCEAIETQDPTALIGLPLMTVRRLLATAGVALP